MNPKLIYPTLALILQLSQKFGEKFDDIGIKVFFGGEVLRFSDRKEGLPTFTKYFLKKKS